MAMWKIGSISHAVTVIAQLIPEELKQEDAEILEYPTIPLL